MTENFVYQASFNIPSGEEYQKGDMVNIRGNDPTQFFQALDAFNDHMAEKVAQVAASVRAQYLVARDLGGQTIEHSRSQPASAPPAQPQGNQPNGYGNAPQNGGNGDPFNNAPQDAPAWTGAQDQGNPWNPQQQPQQAPQQQQAPPQQGGGGIPTTPPPHVGPPPHCSHGEKRFLAKPYKGGKPGYWMAWACPAQRGDNSQHDLEFIRQS